MDPSLYEAASSGNVGFFRKPSDGGVLNQKTPKDNNILHIAAEFKQIKLFEELGFDHHQSPLFWATNKKGNTPLHIAARVGCDEVVKFLINHAKRTPRVEGDVDQESGLVDGDEAHKKLLRKTNLEKDTALHVAARCGHDGVASLLMEADPELCCLTNSGKESPLFVAIDQGFLFIARSILNYDPIPISLSFEGIQGVSALHAVVTYSDGKVVEDIVKIMVKKYPQTIKMVDALGWTPLHYAALRGNLKATQVFMEADSSASYILDKSGMSALHVAAYAGRTKVMEEIIQRRPDTYDLLNNKGQTVLHAAVLGERTEVVKYILKTPMLGGLINEADEDGNTPLHLAALCKNRKILRALAHDERANRTAINKEFLKANGIFIGDNNEELKIKIGSNTALKHLGVSFGLPFYQQQIERDFWKLKSPTEDIADDKTKQERRESRLLIATIIATVTFAAAFTVPGGLGENGIPILYKSDHYKVFLYANQIAFAAVAFVMYNEIVEKPFLSPRTVELLIRISVGGMALTFTASINVVRKAKENMHHGNKVDSLYSISKFTNWFSEITFWVYVVLIFLTIALPRAYLFVWQRPRAYLKSKAALRRHRFRNLN